MTASIAPLLPYAVVGVVLYFYGGKIAALLGSKIASSVGVPIDTKKFGEQASTVAQSISTPLTTTKEVVQYLTGTTGYKGSPAAKKPISTKAKVIAKAGDVVSKVSEVATKARIAAATKATQATNTLTGGLKTVKGASAVEVKGVFSDLFGGIFSTPAPAYISPDEQKAALARIKATKGF